MAMRMKVKGTAFSFAQMADALFTLRQMPHVPARVTLRALRNLTVLQADSSGFTDLQRRFLDRFALKDDAGNFVLVPGLPGRVQIETGEEAVAAAAEMSEAGQEEVEYDLEPLDLDDLTFMEQLNNAALPREVVDPLAPIIVEASTNPNAGA